MKAAKEDSAPQEERIAQALEDMKRELDRLDPSAKTTDDAGWQERKSASTRIALLDSAVECLAKFGYAKTTTQLVAASAKISRGAMLHHYSSKADLISATIDYIMFQRMERFYSEISNLSIHERVDQIHGIEIFWRSAQSSVFDAYVELSVAARTDKALQSVFDVRARAFDDYCFSLMPTFFPEWANHSIERQRLAQDLIMSTLEGLYLNLRIITSRDRRLAVRAHLTEFVKLLRS